MSFSHDCHSFVDSCNFTIIKVIPVLSKWKCRNAYMRTYSQIQWRLSIIHPKNNKQVKTNQLNINFYLKNPEYFSTCFTEYFGMKHQPFSRAFSVFSGFRVCCTIVPQTVTLTVFLKLRSRKTVPFSEQIMPADKYRCIFSRQMEAIVYIT